MKLIIDIPDGEYKTLSKMSEKEKVNELSYYERVIANGIPYESKAEPLHKMQICEYDEAFTIDEMLEETAFCRNCKISSCPNCGADMRG